MKKFLILFFLAFSMMQLWTDIVMAQKSKEIVLELKNERLPSVFKKLEKATHYKIMFITEDVNKFSLNGTIRAKDIESAMQQIIGNKPLEYSIDRQFITVTLKTNTVRKVSNSSSSGSFKVHGKVVDENGSPMPGVNVYIHGTKIGVITNAEGRYAIGAKPDDILSFSFIGYKTEIMPIKSKESINMNMELSSKNLDEVTVVAFGTQKKESVVSSITTIRPMDLKTSNSDLTTSFAGRIPGIVGWQTGGLPGALTEGEMNTKFYIRGITSFQSGANTDPLILLDGVETSKLDLARLAPEDIESFTVMKDASATAMYGARGANGVILVTTKKGEEGSAYTTFRYECVMSQPTRQIDVVDPITYMKMYNQALLARNPGATPRYTIERINRTVSGKYPSWVYPAIDWYSQLFKGHTVNHRAGLNIRGGSKVVQYYAAVNYSRDEGMLKTDKLNDFNCNIVNNETQFRANLNINLNAGIKLVVNSSTTLDKYHGPYVSQAKAYSYAFKASPVDFAPTYPADETYNWPHILFGTTASKKTNPYAEIQKGYINRTRYSTINKAEYIQNLSSLVKGLEFRASASLVQSGYYTSDFKTVPYLYSLVNYDFETGKHVLQAINASDAHRTLKTGLDSHSTDTRVTYEARLLHTASWGDHQTSLTGVFQMQDRTFTPIGSVLDGQPQRNLTYSMRGTYGYKDRYFVEGSFGYNGSERFAPNNRFGFFPAGGMAWVISSEPFMKPVANWLSFLKLRFSYGKVGNDGVVDTPRFIFLPVIGETYAGSDPEAFSTTYLNRYRIDSYANRNIQWEIAEKSNLGLELKLWRGLFEMELDFYKEIRHNIISNRLTIPASMGIEINPLDNIGKTCSKGIDFSGKIQKSFTPDFWVILNGTLTYNRVKYKSIEEATDKPKWQRKIGHEISQPIGYIAEGLFRDWDEINNAPRQDGDVMPGDIRYRDINNDGVIDIKDATYIGFPETPRLTFGFNGFINYKNFEFSFAFQGSGKRSFFIDPSQLSPFVHDHAMLSKIYQDHWSDDNMADRPFWPRLSTYNLVKHNPQEDWYNSNNVETIKSTYFMRSCSFLRCTQLEFAYNLPKKLMQRWGMKNIKLSLKANNPFCFTNFKLWDVELGESGFNYPIQRTYSVSVNLNF